MPIAKRPEPTQKIELLLAERGDVVSAPASTASGHNSRISSSDEASSGLARVGQIPEMMQENNRLPEHPLLRYYLSHSSNQRITTDSALYAFVTHFLHPIALR